MALKPTIFKLRIDISDFNRDYYDSINLTVAQHPSENLQRMMARVVAFCLNAEAGLNFTKGLSEIEQPDIWSKTLDDQITLWIDMGEPSLDRIKKSSHKSPDVRVYSFNSKSDTWWQQTKNKVQQFNNVQFFQLDWSQVQELASMAQRTMNWSLSISGDSIYVSTEEQDCELLVRELVQ